MLLDYCMTYVHNNVQRIDQRTTQRIFEIRKDPCSSGKNVRKWQSNRYMVTFQVYKM